jgi:AcrR family transcriptional regulator
VTEASTDEDDWKAASGTSAAGAGTRDRILAIAAEAFASKGYHATGVAELSEKTGLGQSSLYHHIRSKENLLYEISVSLVKGMVDTAAAIAASPLPAEQRLRLLAREQVRSVSEHRAGLAVSLYEARALTPEHRRTVIGLRRRYVQIWADVMADGAAEGSLRPVSPLILRGLLGLLSNTYLWLDRQGPLSPDQIADEFVDLALEGIKRPSNDLQL